VSFVFMSEVGSLDVQAAAAGRPAAAPRIISISHLDAQYFSFYLICGGRYIHLAK
jgi:hypothetical protein